MDQQTIDQILKLDSEGHSVADIAKTVGLSRPYVSTILSDKGRARHTRAGMETSFVPFTPPKEHRKQHAYMMFKAMDKDADGIPIGKTTRKDMEAFKKGLSKKTWVYDEERGFYFIPRKPEHGKRPFIGLSTRQLHTLI